MLALPAAPPAAHALAFASEYHLDVSRRSAPAGRLVVQVRNIGQDDHDLTVRRLGSARRLGTSGVVHAGGLGALHVSLRPGRYLLYCSIANHAALGMRSVFVVRARAP